MGGREEWVRGRKEGSRWVGGRSGWWRDLKRCKCGFIASIWTEDDLFPTCLNYTPSQTSTEVDLSDFGLLALYSEIHPTISYIVHYGVNMIAPVYKLQVRTPHCGVRAGFG